MMDADPAAKSATPVSSRRLLPAFIGVGILGLMFVAQLASIWSNRLDYPINDDWRYYLVEPSGAYAMPDELSTAWLLVPSEDTVHATGKALDWMAFHWLAHDFRVLAALSFGLCVGTWLWFSVRFVFAGARGNVPVLLGALLLFALPLATNPYWVALSPFQWLEPVIAYHQMLPMSGLVMLICILGRVVASQWSDGLREAALALVTLFFGFTYSSGAVGLVLLGGTTFALTAVARGVRDDAATRRLRTEGLVVLVASLLCLAVHIGLPSWIFDINPTVTTRAFDATLPWDPNFSRFLFALFDRAILSTALGPWPATRGALVFGAVLLPAAVLGVQVLRGDLLGPRRRLAVLVVALLVAVTGYALLVAYGRASFGSFYIPWYPDESPELYARNRFFFWWVSAALPIAAVGWAFVTERLASGRLAGRCVLVVALLMLLPKAQHPESTFGYLGHWNYPARAERDAGVLGQMIEIDAERARGQRPNPNRPDLARRPAERFREQRWFRRVGQRVRPLIREAERQGAEFVSRWSVSFR